MHLNYYTNQLGLRVYTLKKVDPDGNPTLTAHPARFSPVDPYSQHRIFIKKRFGILGPQQPTLKSDGEGQSNVRIKTEPGILFEGSVTVVT